MRLTVERINCALIDCKGFISYVARYLDTSTDTILSWINKHPRLQQTMRDIRTRHLDVAENKVLDAINQGDTLILKWYLSCQGAERGYFAKDVSTKRLEIDANVKTENKSLNIDWSSFGKTLGVERLEELRELLYQASDQENSSAVNNGNKQITG